MKVTQRLLDKIDREMSTNKMKDLHQFLEKSAKGFQIYELCSNEFCFEFDLLQLPLISIFFKRFFAGYHRQINTLLKLLTENPMYISRETVKKPVISEENDREGEITTQEDLRRKSVPENEKKQMKYEQSNVLLRNEISQLTQNAEFLKKQNLQLNEMASKMRFEKQALEEELIRSVKSKILDQNLSMSATTILTKENREKTKETVEDFLSNLKKKIEKKGDEDKKNNEENIVKVEKKEEKSNEEKKEFEDDLANIAEMKIMLEKREKTFEKIKDSGIELRKVLKGINRKKNRVSSKKFSNFFTVFFKFFSRFF